MFPIGMKKLLIQLLICAMLFALIVSCEQENTPEPDTSYFVHKPELLGEGVELFDCDKWLRVPKGYSPAPDSVLELLQATFAAIKEKMFESTMTHCFLDTINQSGLLITRLHNFHLGPDTIEFLSNYRGILQNRYGSGGIIEGEEFIDSVFVKYFAVTDRSIARVQVLCLTGKGDAVELNYFIPDSMYGRKLPMIKSSVSTIKALPRDDDC